VSASTLVSSAAAMRALGGRLGQLLAPGDLVVLSGPLGAGKTVLAQGIGAGLGVPGRVTSPTFVLARVHRGGRIPLVHVDAYRLGSGPTGRAEVDDLDLDAETHDSVTVVEWGEGLVEGLAEDRLEVHIDRLDADVFDADPADAEADPEADPGRRRVNLRGVGSRWRDVPVAILGHESLQPVAGAGSADERRTP
jgi:tRNA threonylcarbamoyladenosine biosynthesis protein TsaE